MRRLPPGLYAIADTGFGDPVRQAHALVEVGVPTLQLRAKGWSLDDLRHAARPIAALCRSHGVCFIVNDHPSVAAEVDADGVHIGAEDGNVVQARAIVGDRLVGFSTRSLDEVRRAQAADYLGFGPVFATTTRAGSPAPRGVDSLAKAVAMSSRPIVAIGGIDVHNAPAVRATGVHAWAVLSALWRSDDISSTVGLLSG